ncbi:hypothetical protein BDV37DRAFT_234887 [Aspergillus pseudonomiae]|uniref:Uncharacterized protein n=1 Tax=Aspergillus pseudonomiae TaxID=1506151 RepID=A0A5N7D0D8_9EURO|nr:uncharacterized protein BDV37DRAFT_234887 [Aspergillus pseudonomiae]KAE8399333.1 hypothetical protein BDV37DRAFT_234887 [Aspergillus pseudonomiae]
MKHDSNGLGTVSKVTGQREEAADIYNDAVRVTLGRLDALQITLSLSGVGQSQWRSSSEASIAWPDAPAMIPCKVVVVLFLIWLSVVIYEYIFQYCHLAVILVICPRLETRFPSPNHTDHTQP